ncbi:hypothetical protein MSP8886_01300 [Marinomonas spartinae]|uniref:Uncharacterized protein n=1 Tax=Marinomonas spartinae TaxID=1792290 RepID=A0A1A8T9Q8_9GAMM|nr:hypothetical protein [Marinomonas spartinae]SBS28749.1 hypothetical protein MSP8886_01300 [Marinomonas spartinae]
MTAVTVTVLLLVIGGFVGVAIVLQLKEQARIEKLRKIASINNQIRQVRRYLDDLPPQYQPKDMRLWLFSRMVTLYDELIQFEPNSALQRRKSHLEQEMTEFQSSKQKRRAKPINDELLIMELKRLLESFHFFIKQSVKEKTLNSDTGARYEGLLLFYKYKLNADFHAYLGRQAFLTGKMDAALSSYKEALSQLAPVKDNPETLSSIKQLEGIIDEIEKELDAKREAEETTVEDEESSINDEWDKFMDDATFKEKKHF